MFRFIIALILTFVLTRFVWWVIARWLEGRVAAWVTFVLSGVIAAGASYYLIFIRRGILVYVVTLLGWLAFDLYRIRRSKRRLKREPLDLDPSKRVYPPDK